MISAILLILVVYYLYKYFYKTVVVLAIWWQVLENVVIGEYPFTWFIAFFIFIFFIYKVEINELQWKLHPFKTPLTLLLICYLISGFMGQAKIRPFFDLMSTFAIPIVSFYAICRIRKIWIFLFKNILLWASLVIAVGLIELYLGFNPVIPLLQSLGISNYTAEQSEDYIRFGMYRCQSLMVWCSTYGVTCGFTAILLLLLYYYKRLSNKVVIYTLVGLLFFGMFTSGTRSVYLAVAIALMSYLLQVAFKFKYLVISLIVCTCVYYVFADFFDQVFLSFVDTRSVGGSSTELRENQLDVALNIFEKRPVLGHGYGACSGFTQKSLGLLGAESFLFWVLIDRGLIGLIATFYLLFRVLKYVYRKTNVWICLFPLGLMIGKFISLFPHIEETYYFFPLYIIIRAYTEYHSREYHSCKLDKSSIK